MPVAVETKVPFTAENVAKCQCSKCPVQSNSQCVRNLASNLQNALKKKPLQHEEIPGLYCGGGKATCSDLNPRSACVCGTCQVFNEDYNLVQDNPAGYFCRGGKA